LEDREQLIAEIEQVFIAARRSARTNYWAAFAFTFLSVGGSIAATILVALSVDVRVSATVAAIPAAAVSVGSAFHFERKAAWHWKKVKLLQGLVRALRYEDEDVEVISRAFSRIDGELDEEWVRFGSGRGGSDETPAA
jgi:hypothetical protein